MAEKALVTFKGKKNGITIILDNHAEFETLKEAFRAKVKSSGGFFSDSQIAVAFTGRSLNKSERETLLSIMGEYTSADIIQAPIVHVMQAPADKSAKDEQANTPERHMTVFHKGSLRSGMSITEDGSIVVLGDVNPGSELTATGNVIVLGSLKGFAHAGAKGDLSCYIAAINLKPTQIRIGDIITYIPQEISSRVKQTMPSYAYVEEGQIYIAKFV